eukprot:353436-Chlamydomonas_euryale.AAC.4
MQHVAWTPSTSVGQTEHTLNWSFTENLNATSGISRSTLAPFPRYSACVLRRVVCSSRGFSKGISQICVENIPRVHESQESGALASHAHRPQSACKAG